MKVISIKESVTSLIADGEYKIGIYAWILKNIEPIYSIPAKGKLNIWNFDGNYKVKIDCY